MYYPYFYFMNEASYERLNNIHLVTVKVSGNVNLSSWTDLKSVLIDNTIPAEYLRLMVIYRICYVFGI